MEEDYLYENERFFVDIERDGTLEDGGIIERDGATYFDCYIVVNKSSGVVEFKTPSLVEAISGAAMADATLISRPWDFYYKRSDVQEAPETVQ